MLRRDADVIVCQEVVSNLSVWAMRLLHRRLGKRLVFMGLFYSPEGSGFSALLRDRGFLRGSALALVAHTDQGRDQLLSEGVPEESIFVTHNTLGTEQLMKLAKGVAE